MWDARRLLRCGERLYRAGKYALCALLIGLLVLLVLVLVSLLRFGAVLFVAGDALLTVAWIAALAACAAGLLGAPLFLFGLHLIALAKIAENTEKSP